MALRMKRSEISANLGMYEFLTKIPAPSMAIWGSWAIEISKSVSFHYEWIKIDFIEYKP